MRLPLSLAAHAVRPDTDMSVRVLFTKFVNQGKRVFQNWQKAVKATQNKQSVKVAQNKAAQLEQKAPTKASGQLQPLWNRWIPRVYYRTLAGELRRKAAWNAGAPLVAFLGLALVPQHEQEEFVEDICELVKSERYSYEECSLLDKIQGLSLEELDIGRLIGKGCNAAVHEARLKTALRDEDNIELVSPSDNDATSDLSHDNSTEVSEYLTSHVDELLEAMQESENSATEILDGTLDGRDDITDTGSDITVLDISEDDITDDEAAPTIFLVQSVVGTVPYVSYSDSDQESNVSFEVIEEQSNEQQVESETESAVRVTHSRILLTLPAPGGDVEQSDEVDGVMESDLEYDSMDSSISGENTPATGSDYGLAVKMMFNYGLDSNTTAIFEGMKKETVPARFIDEQMQRDYLQNGHKVRKKLPPHPNIVEMGCVIVDEVSHLANSFKDYPDALPKRINPDGIGRNMTMYLVMKKYDCTLKDYLSNNSPTFRERLCLFAQLLEALVHLQNHGIAHRDIKSNNILLDCSKGGVPQLVLSDFGCCLADPQNGLKIPYTTDAICKEGNMALMAPEILSAQPGPNSVLDYTKADLWAAGALAYEIFLGENPFYSPQLNSASYREEDLPPLPAEVPVGLQRLITQIVRRNPSQRPTPTFAANVAEVFLWMPDYWLLLSKINHLTGRLTSDWSSACNRRQFPHSLQLLKSDLKLWTAFLAIEVILGRDVSPEVLLKRHFIRRLTTRDILGCLRFCNINVIDN